MPELAEVETVRNYLKQNTLNKKITQIECFYPKMIENDIEYFKKNLINESFIDILRKGKYLIFETNNYYLISHLRMEGKYFIKDKNEEKNKHEHLKFVFNDNLSLRYEDVRKFGRVKLILKKDINEYFNFLGKEPNELTIEYLIEKLKNKNNDIKTILLDQSIISGLGNIYANEVLYAAKINPYKKGKDLTLNEINSIIDSSRKIIKKAIEEGGTTIKSYSSNGHIGNYQKYLKVHKKENVLCENCNTSIKKDKIHGRSTYYCPTCQK